MLRVARASARQGNADNIFKELSHVALWFYVGGGGDRGD